MVVWSDEEDEPVRKELGMAAASDPHEEVRQWAQFGLDTAGEKRDGGPGSPHNQPLAGKPVDRIAESVLRHGDRAAAPAVRQGACGGTGPRPCGIPGRVDDHEMGRLWEAAGSRLEAARRALTDPEAADLGLYAEFLVHNELGLALDELVDVAAAQRAPRSAWEALADAEASMRLDAGDPLHGPTVSKIGEHLTRAEAWVELRRLLNEWDPIGVYDPETNFPEDEYDCLELLLMERLRNGDSAAEIERFLTLELSEHFGLDPRVRTLATSLAGSSTVFPAVA